MRVIAIEAIDPILRVDRYRAGLDLEPLRRLLPLLVHPVGVFAAADDRFHLRLPSHFQGIPAKAGTHFAATRARVSGSRLSPGMRFPYYTASSLKYLTALPAHILCFSSAGTFS